MEKMEFKFIDPDGNKQIRWIDKEEWDFLTAFRHKRSAMFYAFGCRAAGLDEPITEEEYKLFEEWYAEKYPEYNKMLGREDIEKLNKE